MRRTGWADETLRLLLGVVVVALLAACSDGSHNRLSGAGESCTKTGDCQGGLKCVSLVCQQAGADCPGDLDCTGVEDTDSSPTGGTWTDPTSNLTWQVTPTGGTMKWSSAESHCSGLTFGGSSDWRLPSIGELRTLIRGCPATEGGGSCNVEEGACLAGSCGEDSCRGCAHEEGPGDGGIYWPDELEGDCCWYWSSSAVEDDANEAWSVAFNNGLVDGYGGIHHDRHVRCVR